MKLRDWFIKALRRITPNPPEQFRWSWIPLRSQAGVNVNHETALQYAAVWSCVRVIAESLGHLPWHVFESLGDNRNERRQQHPADWLLAVQANPEMDAGTFRETIVAHALTWGNGYAEIERDNAGRIMWLWPITPDRVTPDRANDGRLVYQVSNFGRPPTVIEARDMFHLHGLGFDGTQGYSVIALAAQSIGLGLATERFGASFFGNGATAGTVLEHPGKLSKEARENLERSINNKLQGPNKAFTTMVLEEGMKIGQMGIPPEQAQFLETRKFSIPEICRWFRVPPHKIYDLERATFSNIEHQSIEFVQDTILPWVGRLEREANIKLFGLQQRGRLFTKMNVNGLLRGDAKSRAEFYREMRNMGVMSVNEIRALEDFNPIGPEGDKRVIQVNMTTLDKIGEEQPAPDPPRGNGQDGPVVIDRAH